MGVIELLTFVLSNVYIMFGGVVFKQNLGIPMGSNCCVEVANLFGFSFEFPFLMRQLHAFVESCSPSNQPRSILNAHASTLGRPLPHGRASTLATYFT